MRELKKREIFFIIMHLDKVSNVHWHFFNLSVVELFDISHHTDVFVGNKVNSNTLTTETTTTTNSVNVVFTVGGKIVAIID